LIWSALAIQVARDKYNDNHTGFLLIRDVEAKAGSGSGGSG